MRQWLKRRRGFFLSVRTHIALLATGIVLLAGAAGTMVVAAYALNSVEAQLGRQVLHVAQTVAEIDDVKRFVGRDNGELVIQPIAERIRQVNGVEYVVVLDMAHRRYSHPVPARIGTLFTGGDEGPAFAEHSYVSRAAGMWGNSIRAFVPVMSEDFTKQTGVVVVGVLTPSVLSAMIDLAPELCVALLVALSVGLIGAWLLGTRIKQQLIGLEPPEIARLLQERVAILNAIGDGVLAIDRNERVTVLSEQAQRILGRGPEAIGLPVQELVPYSRLPEILRSGEPELDQEMLLGTTVVLTNRVPVRIQGQIIGAVATFRDRTEVHRLADQLTGVTKFIDSVRAQNHEHMNRLHTIAGLVQFGRTQEAMDYIYSSYEEQQEQTQFLTRRFRDYRVAALLLGKLHRARELNITVTVDPNSRLRLLPRTTDASSLVVMVGNLLENAMDAVAGGPPERRQVYCLIRDDGEGLQIVVRDTGHGIPPELVSEVWRPGFSTKAGQHQGIGLALVRQHVESAGGQVSFVTGPEGTTFEIWIPREESTPEGAEPV
ncbi:MAG TPA: sensor histidine kinase [Symbiobacteriaceae bacterium]|nr:sensor histidine kinase [Symbiobacteriaceae bacterium]